MLTGAGEAQGPYSISRQLHQQPLLLDAAATRTSPAAQAPRPICPTPTAKCGTCAGRALARWFGWSHEQVGCGIQELDKRAVQGTPQDPGVVTVWCQGRAMMHCRNIPAMDMGSTGRGMQDLHRDSAPGPALALTPCCHRLKILGYPWRPARRRRTARWMGSFIQGQVPDFAAVSRVRPRAGARARAGAKLQFVPCKALLADVQVTDGGSAPGHSGPSNTPYVAHRPK